MNTTDTQETTGSTLEVEKESEYEDTLGSCKSIGELTWVTPWSHETEITCPSKYLSPPTDTEKERAITWRWYEWQEKHCSGDYVYYCRGDVTGTRFKWESRQDAGKFSPKSDICVGSCDSYQGNDGEWLLQQNYLTPEALFQKQKLEAIDLKG